MRKLDATLNETSPDFAIKTDAFFQYAKYDEQMVSDNCSVLLEQCLHKDSVNPTTDASIETRKQALKTYPMMSSMSQLGSTGSTTFPDEPYIGCLSIHSPKIGTRSGRYCNTTYKAVNDHEQYLRKASVTLIGLLER